MIRRVLARDDAVALGRLVLDIVGDRSKGVSIEHTARAVTKITNGSLLNTDDGDRVRITFSSECGSGLPIDISANQLNDARLRQMISRAMRIAPPEPASSDVEADDPDDPQYFTYNQRPHLPVSLWHESTIGAMDSARAEVIPALVEQIRASAFVGAATIGLVARSSLYMYKQGLTAFSEETDCEVTMTARTSDGTTSGWDGQAHRNWTRITPSAVAAGAIDMAHRSRGAVALEPGRRMAILGPAAVAQLVRAMAPLFDFLATRQVGRLGTPFTLLNYEPSGRHTKLGVRVFDPRLMMVSDPADPEGGFAPFFEQEGIERIIRGYPTAATTWINRGVLVSLAYDVGTSLERNLTACDAPRSVRLTTTPGTRTATIGEMIANCHEGIYVNRFSDVRLIDMASGMMTGVTRDGCFLVKNGKIDKPIKNFRFLDSPFFKFNTVEMIGTPVRVPFGYHAASGGTDWQRWPCHPIIVPPMMVQDFNFSGLATAV
jgi:predicted Zn-dependent protease